ncbi:hypothetical protein BCR33DRAFT_722465 [Rhizoclosmatium globosum]|uniref:Uncharacterized protein n=1 Tax=Rhizoclosmatium globosum TaxID=329046 RepID=A0A1Y2BMP7_9FUNG|nr:hypothetical protein BCR33DRAFT_722465 [Rhizoclosmatium globosum]|eukprot:ORY35992.1 hypothetical protein BCR33DRAFT_722465 [Rhizoclosmatium globosum]
MKSTIVLAALTSTTFAQTTFSSPSAQLTSILQDLPTCTSSLEQKLVEPFVGFGTVYCDAVKKSADQVGTAATKTGGGSVAATITGAANATGTGDVDNGDSQAATTDVATQTVAVDGNAALQSTSTTSSASTAFGHLDYFYSLVFFKFFFPV